MLSSDKNIETVVQFIDQLKDYFESEKEYLKLSATEKTVRILSAIIVICIMIFGFFLFMFFAGLTLAAVISHYTNSIIGFSATTGIILLLFFVLYSSRKTLIEKPLVKLLASIILSK